MGERPLTPGLGTAPPRHAKRIAAWVRWGRGPGERSIIGWPRLRSAESSEAQARMLAMHGAYPIPNQREVAPLSERMHGHGPSTPPQDMSPERFNLDAIGKCRHACEEGFGDQDRLPRLSAQPLQAGRRIHDVAEVGDLVPVDADFRGDDAAAARGALPGTPGNYAKRAIQSRRSASSARRMAKTQPTHRAVQGRVGAARRRSLDHRCSHRSGRDAGGLVRQWPAKTSLSSSWRQSRRVPPRRWSSRRDRGRERRAPR